MITKNTVVDQIEITRSGHVQIRLGLLLVEDGKEINCLWHRTVINPGVSPEDQMNAVKNHLSEMGYPSVADSDMARIKNIISVT